MKIWFLADLHQEFPHLAWRPEETPDHDVLVLAGDIHQPGVRSVHYARDLTEKPIIMVAGNHEAYSHEWHEMIADAKVAAHSFDNIHYLENESVEIDGITFIGAALWTDFECYHDINEARAAAAYQINDYMMIDLRDIASGMVWPLSPNSSIGLHQASRRFISKRLKQCAKEGKLGKTVVVTHHAPCFLGTDQKHRDDPSSAAFLSDMSEFIFEYNPAVWLHGHTHYGHDSLLGNTRVISNQKGYSNDVTGWPFRPDFVFEV